MKKDIFLIALVFIFLQATVAELVWDKKEIEVKPKGGVEKVTATFHFTNSGTNAVTISNVQTSCGCTTAELKKKRYEAGESGEINAVFTVGTRTGLQQKQILVFSDASGKSPTALMFKIDLPEVLKLEPNSVEWKVGETNTVRVIQATATNVPVKIVEIASFSPEVEVKWKEIDPGKSYQIEAKLLKADKPLLTALRISALVGTNERASDFMVRAFVK